MFKCSFHRLNTKMEISLNFWSSHETFQSFVALENAGNNCFLAAGTQIAVGLEEISQLVRQLWFKLYICHEARVVIFWQILVNFLCLFVCVFVYWSSQMKKEEIFGQNEKDSKSFYNLWNIPTQWYSDP